MSRSVPLALALALAWLPVSGEISLPQFVLGLLFGTFSVLLTGAGRGEPFPLRRAPRRLLYLALYLFALVPVELVRSNLDMALRLLRRRPRLRPGIVRFPLEPGAERAAALLGHLITMTPGEMVVDYSPDGRALFVHLIDAEEAEARQASVWRLYREVLEGVVE